MTRTFPRYSHLCIYASVGDLRQAVLLAPKKHRTEANQSEQRVGQRLPESPRKLLQRVYPCHGDRSRREAFHTPTLSNVLLVMLPLARKAGRLLRTKATWVDEAIWAWEVLSRYGQGQLDFSELTSTGKGPRQEAAAGLGVACK